MVSQQYYCWAYEGTEWYIPFGEPNYVPQTTELSGDRKRDKITTGMK